MRGVWGGSSFPHILSPRAEACSLIPVLAPPWVSKAADGLRLVICSFHEYFLSICWAPAAVLGLGHGVNKAGCRPALRKLGRLMLHT